MQKDPILTEGLRPQYTYNLEPQSVGTAFASFGLPHKSFTAEIS